VEHRQLLLSIDARVHIWRRSCLSFIFYNLCHYLKEAKAVLEVLNKCDHIRLELLGNFALLVTSEYVIHQILLVNSQPVKLL